MDLATRKKDQQDGLWNKTDLPLFLKIDKKNGLITFLGKPFDKPRATIQKGIFLQEGTRLEKLSFGSSRYYPEDCSDYFVILKQKI